jgi:hypothetical protein
MSPASSDASPLKDAMEAASKSAALTFSHAT